MQNKGLGQFWKFSEMGGGPYNNLWSMAVLGHGASWSLVVAKGQGGLGCQLVTPCARSAVADFLTDSAVVDDDCHIPHAGKL